jgi:PKD repeat protein
VTVSAKDEYGKTGTATGTITILSAPVVNAGSPVTVNAESSLTFSQATETGGTAPFAYTWNFGDGTNQTGSLNPSHTYPNPGSYTATVTVTDANKLTSSSSVVVTVKDVVPTVTYTDPPAVAGSPVSYTASATDVSPADQAAGFTPTPRTSATAPPRATRTHPPGLTPSRLP